MVKARSNTGKSLAKKWNLPVKHALYRKTGDWYHQLEKFPGALLDESGYVIFETEKEYRRCPELKIRQDVSCPGGISKIPGYTSVTVQGNRPEITYEKETFKEGSRRDVVQSSIERNRSAREACIKAHGLSCVVCKFNFGSVYGDLGQGFIHVHHLNPLSGGERDVDPVNEMVPLCPNCHAMAHRQEPPLTIKKLKTLVKKST